MIHTQETYLKVFSNTLANLLSLIKVFLSCELIIVAFFFYLFNNEVFFQNIISYIIEYSANA